MCTERQRGQNNSCGEKTLHCSPIKTEIVGGKFQTCTQFALHHQRVRKRLLSELVRLENRKEERNEDQEL